VANALTFPAGKKKGGRSCGRFRKSPHGTSYDDIDALRLRIIRRAAFCDARRERRHHLGPILPYERDRAGAGPSSLESPIAVSISPIRSRRASETMAGSRLFVQRTRMAAE
jgi:hypothetical protein